MCVGWKKARITRGRGMERGNVRETWKKEGKDKQFKETKLSQSTKGERNPKTSH
jgi:hypothetical protein